MHHVINHLMTSKCKSTTTFNHVIFMSSVCEKLIKVIDAQHKKAIKVTKSPQGALFKYNATYNYALCCCIECIITILCTTTKHLNFMPDVFSFYMPTHSNKHLQLPYQVCMCIIINFIQGMMATVHSHEKMYANVPWEY